MTAAPLVVGVDAGGTSTRAALVDGVGRCWGLGRSGPGNPSAHGAAVALGSMAEAIRAALAMAGAEASQVALVVIAMAGEPEALQERLHGLAGLPSGVAVELTGDALAMFVSGTASPDGGVVLAGTGSIAARVEGRQVSLLSGGLGWLVSDAGSGFAVGREVARAVIADLDGLGPATRLTGEVRALVDLAPSLLGRAAAEQLSARLRRDPPAALARLAPLAVAAARGASPDPIAQRIAASARDEIAGLVRALRMEPRAPVVLGGGFLVGGLLASPGQDELAAELADRPVHLAADGLLGACTLALGRVGIDVDAGLHARLRDSCAAPTRPDSRSPLTA